jgi:hypothetical protein
MAQQTLQLHRMYGPSAVRGVLQSYLAENPQGRSLILGIAQRLSQLGQTQTADILHQHLADSVPGIQDQ